MAFPVKRSICMFGMPIFIPVLASSRLWHIPSTRAMTSTRRFDILDSIELQQPVRLLGVRLTHLKYQAAQLPLFPQEQRKALMVRAMDAVNNRYGDDTVTFASLMDTEEKGSHVISPAWRPDGIRCVDIK